ncbi:hypothetical protein [Streptomyces yangpuensis]|uniref:hypothetical protein n=1 Tax=Streptomyces yangpuensis TaxID=1648182 RepID=UPI0036C9055D
MASQTEGAIECDGRKRGITEGGDSHLPDHPARLPAPGLRDSGPVPLGPAPVAAASSVEESREVASVTVVCVGAALATSRCGDRSCENGDLGGVVAIGSDQAVRVQGDIAIG